MLKYKSGKHNIFIEDVRKIALTINDDKKIQSTHSKEAYACGISKNLVCKKEEINCNKITKQYKND